MGTEGLHDNLKSYQKLGFIGCYRNNTTVWYEFVSLSLIVDKTKLCLPVNKVCKVSVLLYCIKADGFVTVRLA